MITLVDKIAVVTGAAQGIGKVIAETLARCGADLVIADIQMEKAESVAQEIAANTGRRAIAVRVDVTDHGSAKAMIDRAIAEFGQVDILVNNAGTTRDKLLMQMKESEWDTVLNVNLKSVYNCCRAVIRPMLRARKGGRIINISSVSGLGGQVGQTNYSASKAGIIGFTMSLAKEVGPRQITVNAIAPGYIPTLLTDDLPEELKQTILQMTPLGRFGRPEDIAHVVAFLASEKAAYITGVTLRVDGGLAIGS